MVQRYLRFWKPKFLGLATQFIYAGSNISFGKNFRCDSIPRILIDKTAKISFGHHVELRRNVEIRAHGTSQIAIDNNVRIDRGVRILAANNARISLSKKVRIGLYSVLNGGDSISIGEGALISGFVYLQTSMHGFKNKNEMVQNQGYSHAPVVLEKDTWLGTHAVILPGVTLAQGTVVGSNAVVTQSTPKYAVVGGVPAKIIKERT